MGRLLQLKLHVWTGGLLLVADRWSVLQVSAARTTLVLQQQQDSSKETPDTCDFKLLSVTTHTSAMNHLSKITIYYLWFGTPTYTCGYDESTNADLRLLGHTPAVRHTTPSLGGGAGRAAGADRASGTKDKNRARANVETTTITNLQWARLMREAIIFRTLYA